MTGGPLQVLPVGKSANQAVVAAPLGARVSMVGAVGGDANGAMLLESLRDAGVDASRVQRLVVSAGTALTSVDNWCENTIIISGGANGHLTPTLVHDAAAPLMGTRALGLCLEGGPGPCGPPRLPGLGALDDIRGCPGLCASAAELHQRHG